jgi:hypothetical protein
MTQTQGWLMRLGRRHWRDLTGHRARRPVTPQPGERLEPRVVCSVSSLTASVSPRILRQINPMNQPHSVQVAVIRPVTLAGYVTESTGGIIPQVSFRVVDSSGRHMPSRMLAPQFVMMTTPGPPNLFFFEARFGLNRTRPPGERQRRYTVLVTAQDPQSQVTVAIPVTTPPARGSHSGGAPSHRLN